MNPLKLLFPSRLINLFFLTDRSTESDSRNTSVYQATFYIDSRDHSNSLISSSPLSSPSTSVITAREQQQQRRQLPSDLIIVKNTADTSTGDIDNRTDSSCHSFTSETTSTASSSSSSSSTVSSNRASTAIVLQEETVHQYHLSSHNMVSENNRNQLITHNYHNMNHNNNNNNNQSARVLGVLLTSDRIDNQLSSSSTGDSSAALTILESIVLDKDIESCTVEELRRLIISQLACAPKKFAFLTKDG